MADKPITFSGPMVRALLAGTKTQTRRFLSDTPRPYLGTSVDLNRIKYDFGGDLHITQRIAVGDRLYVREHWRTWQAYDALAPRDLSPDLSVQYEAGQEEPWPDLGDMAGKFRQAMHMPKWASRITLHVTEVRVQRLQEISEADATAEGVAGIVRPDGTPHGVQVVVDNVVIGGWLEPRPSDIYSTLMDHLHGPGFWDSNPWVTATTFEAERCHIDQARAA